MKKIIITHIKPDLDALTSVWLIKRFWPDWAEAEVKFVPAGSGYQPKENEEVKIVDTGGGEFDHHQAGREDEITSAAQLVLQALEKQRPFREVEKTALRRLVKIVTEIDNFRELKWPRAEADYHLFSLAEIIDAWTLIYHRNYQRVVALTLLALDAVLLAFKDRIRAEEEIKKGIEIQTPWGRGIYLKTVNGAVEHLAQKLGYVVVVRKDPKKGNLRLVGRWDKGVDFSDWYRKLLKKDSQATWFLHNSKCMLLNGAGSNPAMKASRLDFQDLKQVLNLQEKED